MSEGARNSRNSFINNVIWYVVGILDYLNTSAIYTGYVAPAMAQAFAQSLQFIFFPIYAINTAIYAILSVTNLLFDREQETNKLKKENIVRLIISMLSVAIVTTAVVGALAFSAVMGVASTFLFAANLAITGVYNFSAGFYHLYHFVVKGRQLKDPLLSAEDRERITDERKAHFGSMAGYFVVGATIAMVALAGALAVLGGFLPLAGIGIAAGVIGALFCAYALYRKVKETREKNAANNIMAEPPVAGLDSGDIKQQLSRNQQQTYTAEPADNPISLQTDEQQRAEERQVLLPAEDAGYVEDHPFVLKP